ncbi:hypothetical protein [Jongsikchunia kroppenstedtii]|uniref:hypothetical protein n=1 Tax=Jongsikchunia kroppenstedtii TaxID=1121721 RepID=UPI0003A4DEF8|nr:hypothetical protein [Jongsikchunia kroppenstedtii]
MSTIVVVLLIGGGIGGYFAWRHFDKDDTRHMSLRQTVEKVEALNATRLDQIEPYVVPACYAMIKGLSEAFGGEDDGTPSEHETIVSVDEKTGQVKTRDAHGEVDTQHWVKTDQGWQLSCEGMFTVDSSTDPTTSESEVTADETTEDTTSDEDTETEDPADQSTTDDAQSILGDSCNDWDRIRTDPGTGDEIVCGSNGTSSLVWVKGPPDLSDLAEVTLGTSCTGGFIMGRSTDGYYSMCTNGVWKKYSP